MRVLTVLRGRTAAITMILLASVVLLGAQSVRDPRTAEFDPSPDHYALAPDGTPVVASYTLELYVAGATTPFESVSLGKPVPDPDGKIRVDFLNLLSAVPASGIIYEARVSAVGPGGSAYSAASNSFDFSAPCPPTLSSTGLSAPAVGGTGNVSMSAAEGCTWTAVSNTDWITITGGSSGSGPGTITFDVAENPGAASRTGTISAAGQTFTVVQAGAACTYALTPTSLSVPAAGGTGSVGMSSASGCPWTASSSAAWITITAGASGSGNGTIGFSVASNPTMSSRTGTITAEGRAFTVTQAGAPCTYAVVPTAQSMTAPGGTGTVMMTAGTDCTWTATSSAPWITITAGASGAGSGTIGFTVAPNSGTAARTGTITAGGQTFTLTQAGVPCTFALAPTSQSMTAAGGSGTATMTASTDCTWTATSNAPWITITAGASGAGSGTIGFTVAPNPATSSRTGTITAGGQTFTVTQEAVACTYALTPANQWMPVAGGAGSVGVSTAAGCSWTAGSNTPWITITAGTSGTGEGTTSFRVEENPTTSSRSGAITIAGQTFTVTQAGAGCTYALASTGQFLTAAGGAVAVALTSGEGCAWTATSNTAWITVTAGAGIGPGTVSLSVGANPNTSGRTGTITAGGQTFTVTQAGAPCTFALAPTSHSVPAAGATGAVALTASTGCSWVAISSVPWITVTDGASGSGSGTISFSVAANPGAATRTGTLSIGGQTFTVTQAGGACSYAIAPTSQSVSLAGGTGTITMTSGAGCTWTATASAAWITITSGWSGSGPGTIGFSVAANLTTSARTGTIAVGGQTFTVTQAGTGCEYAFTPTAQSVPAAGGSATVTMTANTGCTWTAASNAAWITITAGSSGSGSGMVSFSIAPNLTTSTRTATITAGGQTLTVTQAGPGCTYAFATTGQFVSAAGGTAAVTLTAAAGCDWTAISNAAWITITAGASGTGSGTISLSVAANPGSSWRTGTITAGGKTFTVTQAGVPCTFALAPTSQSVSAAGGTGTVSMTASAGCTWVAISSTAWITITSGASGSGPGTVSFSVAANPATFSRAGTISIGGKTFTVTQAAAEPPPTGLGDGSHNY